MRIPYEVTSEASDLMYELIFGTEGGWIGYILLSSMMFLVTAKCRIAGIPFTVVSIFIAIRMVLSGFLTTDNDLWWLVILYFVNCAFLLFLTIRGD